MFILVYILFIRLFNSSRIKKKIYEINLPKNVTNLLYIFTRISFQFVLNYQSIRQNMKYFEFFSFYLPKYIV